MSAPHRKPMHAGAHILYKKAPNHAAQDGRILRAVGATATISTATATTEASAEQLAPHLPSGSEVMLRAPHPGEPGLIQAPPAGLDPSRVVPATVLHDDSDTVRSAAHAWRECMLHMHMRVKGPRRTTTRLPDASTAKACTRA
jgi:hypothetical protein